LDGLLEVWLLRCLQVGSILPVKAPFFRKVRIGFEMTSRIVLPGFGHNITPADRTDVQGIIQYKMFGDKTHTGNGAFAHTPLLCHVTKSWRLENCRKGDGNNPGNKDCQIVYGAGTLSMALGMSNFDTIVFLTHFNIGMHMTIPEIAKGFYVVDENKKGDGADKMATISCHAKNATTQFRAV